jgi:alkanesulfonate monooxygenase SsuD/methylene tetrahydromethanopterin reductase-like flavin-dependent oxidoreductase (luciferase family)
LARAAEEAGYDSMVMPDSICYPRHAVSRYPFSPDGSREFLEDKPFLEPFSLISALGAVTSRLRFVTFVLKLPVRDPVLVAKQATSTAVLTGGRLVLGAGVSPWREDYEVLGVDWASRGQRMDESVAILRGLAAGGYFEYHGKIFDLPPVKIAPVPPDPIPVLIGVIRTPRCAVPPGWGTAGCTAGETRRTCPACSPGSPASGARKAPTTARSRCT